MDILDDMGGVNYQQKFFFFKVNYFNIYWKFVAKLPALSARAGV